MIPVNVTLQYVRKGVKDSQRVTLSMDARVDETITALIDNLELPREDNGLPLAYRLVRQRQMLDSEAKLFEIGVQEGDILQLTLIDPRATVGQAVLGGVLQRLGGKSGGDPLPVTAALVTAAGEVFELEHTRALIGRADEKMGYPTEALDADLTNLDPKRTVSRPHALVVYADNGFSIRDLYSQHGLMLNGTRIAPNRAQPLHDGDMLQLGDVVVQFRCGY